MMYKRLLLSLTLVVAQGCSDGNNNDDGFPAGTVGISGQADGIAGEITIDVNGLEETLGTNGRWTSERRINQNDNYSVTLVNTNDMNCDISNSDGIANADVIDVNISCTGSTPTAFDLNVLGFDVTSPSVVTFAFHLIDRFTNRAIDQITPENLSDYLIVTEDGLPISSDESFLEIAPFDNVNAQYSTVFAIDVSSSMSSRELETVTTAIKGLIADEITGSSKLEPNQYVSILTFDSTVTSVFENSQDITLLFEALDSITIGAPSTNLFGAIEQGVEFWSNQVSLQNISYGHLILFTDGNDTSSSVSQKRAVEAIKDKDVFFITIGDDVDANILQELTDTNRVYNMESFDQLATNLEDAYRHVKTFEDGLYLLSYASPKRADSHSITVNANDDWLCSTALTEDERADIQNNGVIDNCDDSYTNHFNADDFTDVKPELTLTGANTTLVPEVTWHANLRWSRESADFNWQVNVCAGDMTTALSEDNSQLHFTRNSDQVSIAYIQLSESNTETSVESYMVMAPSENSLASIARISDLTSQCANER